MTVSSVLVDKQCQVLHVISLSHVHNFPTVDTLIYQFSIMFTNLAPVHQFHIVMQMPLMLLHKSLLIITQMPISLRIVTPPLRKGHIADDLGSAWLPA